jgi:hypothetical protein
VHHSPPLRTASGRMAWSRLNVAYRREQLPAPTWALRQLVYEGVLPVTYVYIHSFYYVIFSMFPCSI